MFTPRQPSPQAVPDANDVQCYRGWPARSKEVVGVTVRDPRLTVATLAKILIWAVYVWVLLNLVLLFVAFWLRLLGANPDAGFTEWVYRSVSRSMAPFRGMFEPIALSDQSVLDTSLLFAMIIYGLVALFLRIALDWITDRVMHRRHDLQQEAWAQQEMQRAAATATAAVAPPGGPLPGTTPPGTVVYSPGNPPSRQSPQG
jgi:uncharacterized protein YggT (Ycf19 family)